MPDKFHDYGSNYYPYIDKMLNKFHELSMHLPVLTISIMIKTQLTVSLHIHMHSLTIFIPILS